MPTMRETWTDERLDDFTSVRAEIAGLRDQTAAEFASIRTELVQLRDQIGRVDARLDGIQRTMVLGFTTMSAAVLGGMVAISVAFGG